MNELLGIKQIGAFVGLNDHAGYWYSSQGRLPEPDMTNGTRRFWFTFTIAEWAKENAVGKYKFL